MSSPPQVCLVTTGHPSTNPRLVKEADALVEAGYVVRVVAAKFAAWADMADAAFEGRHWTVRYVRFGEMAPGITGGYRRARRLLARKAINALGLRPPLVTRALHYIVPELAREAVRVPANLYIAHNLAALPAAAYAARRHGARLGFDAEDFHRGELPASEEGSLTDRLTRWTETRYIPQCDYVTAASDGIAAAYADALGIPPPVTVLNVFPLFDREVRLSPSDRAREKERGTVSLYWFSQTIGAGRGLEDVVKALPTLPDHVVLTLRGQWAPGYEAQLRSLAERLGVGGRVRALPPASPHEMVARAACHDIGLALEQPRTLNRRLCVTNKIFTYLLAGVPTVATDTPGQRGVCEQAPDATRVVAVGAPQEFSQAVCDMLDDAGVRCEAKQAARSAGDRFNWESERGRFLGEVLRVAPHGPSSQTSSGSGH